MWLFAMDAIRFDFEKNEMVLISYDMVEIVKGVSYDMKVKDSKALSLSHSRIPSVSYDMLRFVMDSMKNKGVVILEDFSQMNRELRKREKYQQFLFDFLRSCIIEFSE